MATIDDIKNLIESIESKQEEMFRTFRDEIEELSDKISKKESTENHGLSDFDSVKLKIIMKDFLKNESAELLSSERERISKLEEGYKNLGLKIDKLTERVEKIENSKKSDYLENKINLFVESFEAKILNLESLIAQNRNNIVSKKEILSNLLNINKDSNPSVCQDLSFDSDQSYLENGLDKISDKEIKISEIKDDIEFIKTKINTTLDNKDLVKSRIDAIEFKLSEIIIDLDDRFSHIKKEISDIEGYVLKSWVTDDDLLKFTEDLERKIIPKDVLLETIDEKIESVNNKIGESDKKISLMSENISDINSNISKIDIKLDSFESKNKTKDDSEKYVSLSDFETELQYLKHKISDSINLKKDIEESLSYLKLKMEHRVTKEQLSELKIDFDKKIEQFEESLQQISKIKPETINKIGDSDGLDIDKKMVIIQNFFS
ncbi:hypothetical protein JXR93_09210 [bacterium]|nr:hypothetical protein [bacterium]